MHSPGRQQAYGRIRRFGTFPGRSGVWLIAVSGLVGLVATMLAHSEPGDLLGLFLIAGTLVAALGVRTDAVHLIIPAPALVYLAAALIAGLIHDRAADTSHTAILIHAVQWIAGGFLAIVAATLLAIAVYVARKLRMRSLAGPAPRSPVDYRHRRDVDRPSDSSVRPQDPVRRQDPDRRQDAGRGDPDWGYLYDRNPDDPPDAPTRSHRRYQ